MKEDSDIDFEILLKKISCSINDQEAEIFDKWLNSSSDHHAYFQQVEANYSSSKNTSGFYIDGDEAWKNIKSGLKDRGGQKNIKWRTIVAASVSILALAIFLWVMQQELPSQKTVTNNETILPGSDKALLIKTSGQIVELIGNQSFDDNDEHAKIVNKEGRLIYENRSGNVTKSGKNTLVVPRGGKYSIVLSDGTNVFLNSESTLKFPVVFNQNERVVELYGEAYFEVKEDKKRPFRVVSPHQQITVLGTSFNVTAYEDVKDVVTTLVEGRIALNTEGQSSLTYLSPHEQTIYHKESGAISKRPVDATSYVGWKNDKFIFEEERLDNMLLTLSRWYDVDVFYEDDEKRDISFTGEIERYQNFDRILKLIAKTNSVQFEIKDKTIIVN